MLSLFLSLLFQLDEKESTLSFMSQQNMISRQLTVGMRNRLKLHEQQQTNATVQARREIAHQRRHQVHQILFENFNRRRQVRTWRHSRERLALRPRCAATHFPFSSLCSCVCSVFRVLSRSSWS